MKKISGIILSLGFVLSLCVGCGSNEPAAKVTSNPEEITIAYQFSIGYAPLLVMKELNLIEKCYDGDVQVNWSQISSGATINEGMTVGTIDAGAVGVPVAVSGIMAGVPYRIAYGLCAQPYGIVTNSDQIESLSDIASGDQIAVPNINSMNHIMLAIAAKAELGDAHALDGNLTALSNADGYAALVSGAVTCHVAISPYNFMEVKNTDAAMHEIEINRDVWPVGNSSMVVVATESLKSKPELFTALLTAAEEAVEYIRENPRDVAEILAKDYDASSDEILEWMSDERSVYSMELHGVMDMAEFMVEEGFLDEGPNSFDDLVYENVKGD